jgi:hypothetical protein
LTGEHHVVHMEERSNADRVLAKTLEGKKPFGMNE